jgi:hypothetical protein
MRKLLPLVLLGLAGCATFTPPYTSSLLSVQRPADVQQRWGEYKIEPATAGYAYEDNLIRAVLGLGGGGVAIQLENKTDHAMQVVWDEAAFVLNGQSTGVMSGETRFVDFGRPQPPTVIPGHASARLTAIPKSQVDTRNSRVVDFTGYGRLAAKVPAHLLLPLRVQDVVNPYTFIFEMNPPTPAP